MFKLFLERSVSSKDYELHSGIYPSLGIWCNSTMKEHLAILHCQECSKKITETWVDMIICGINLYFFVLMFSYFPQFRIKAYSMISLFAKQSKSHNMSRTGRIKQHIKVLFWHVFHHWSTHKQQLLHVNTGTLFGPVIEKTHHLLVKMLISWQTNWG